MSLARPKTIQQLLLASDVVLKAEVLSTHLDAKSRLKSPWWKTQRAQLRVISKFKGDELPPEIDFLYVSNEASDLQRMSIDNGSANNIRYVLEPGRTYFFFAKRKQGSGETVLMQLNAGSGQRIWEGCILAADNNEAAQTADLHAAIWTELVKELSVDDVGTRAYGAAALLSLSGDPNFQPDASFDFSPAQVLDLILKNQKVMDFLTGNPRLLHNFILWIGAASPYTNVQADSVIRYLQSKSPNPSRVWTPWPKAPGANLKDNATFLLQIADGKSKVQNRAAAIRALGKLNSDTALARLIKGRLPYWLKDASAAIREAAALLSADYPEVPASARRSMFNDPAPAVRGAAALAVGVLQDIAFLPDLEKQLLDGDEYARERACIAILALPAKDTEQLFLRNIDQVHFGNRFLARLAQADPVKFREHVLKQSQSGNTNTSANPALSENPFLKLMLKYLETLEDGDLRKPVCAPYLQELENKSIKERNCLTELYAFYRVRGMNDEAQQYKKKALEADAGTVGSTLTAEFERVENDYVSGVLKLRR